MKKHILTIAAILLIAITALGAVLFLATSGEDTHLSHESPTFPALHITSSYDPFTVERNFWHNGTLTLTNTEEAYAFSDVDVRIRGRGNSTWVRGGEKRPLRLRFEEARSFLGSDYAHRDWILLANHFDASLMRNYAAFHLANSLDGLDFTPFSRFVHLYVNGEYRGVYQLTDERDVGPGRAPLTFDPDPAISEYFFELDGHIVGWLAEGNVEGEDFFTVNGMAYDIRFPSSNRWDGHLEYLQAFVQTVNDAIHSRDFAAIEAMIYLPSFVDFYIVQELTKNIDVGAFSVFMTVRGQGEDRRLHFGPVWDFDRSIGNTLYWPEPEHIHAAYRNEWFRELLETPEVFALVADRWNEVRDAEIAQTIAHTRYTAERYQSEFERNFERHPGLLGRPHQPTPEELWRIDSFMGHVNYMTDWLEARVGWLDDFFNDRPPQHIDWFSERYDPEWALVLYYTYESPITVIVDGETQALATSPVLLENRLLIPAQELETVLGLRVSYDSATELLTLERNATMVTHRVGSSVFTINDVEIESTSSMIVRDYIYVPLRTIADILGYEIEWQRGARTVIIRSPADE